MPIQTQEELLALMKGGRIAGLALRQMQRSVRVGMTTGELDVIGESSGPGTASGPRP
jgi:methionine aminopeptidase